MRAMCFIVLVDGLQLWNFNLRPLLQMWVLKMQGMFQFNLMGLGVLVVGYVNAVCICAWFI